MGNPHRDKARRQKRGEGEFHNRMGDAFTRYGSMDVSIHGSRPDRPDRPDRDRRDRYDRPRHDDRPPRKRLEFNEVKTFNQRDCRVRITMAEGDHGRIYNFTVERFNRDRPSRFFRDFDADDLVAMIQQARDWIETARSGDV